jgi:hypothetical protein
VHSLLNPEFGIVVPEPQFEKVTVAYQLPYREYELRDLVSGWVQLKKSDGTIDRLFDYWVLGREAVRHKPRWSVIRDVLHWVE